MFNVEQFLSLDGYDTDIRISRRKNSEINSQEFFTPYSIVKRMCDKVSDEDWSDPDKTFCEPSFGNGQFLIYIIYNRILHGVSWKRALETTYGVELMQDNVTETYERILSLLNSLNEYGIIKEYEINNIQEAINIMKKNLVCHDFFTWNFEEWRPYTEDELKKINKKK